MSNIEPPIFIRGAFTPLISRSFRRTIGNAAQIMRKFHQQIEYVINCVQLWLFED